MTAFTSWLDRIVRPIRVSSVLSFAAWMAAGCSGGSSPLPNPASTTASAPVGQPPILGTWRVVKFCEDDSTGRLYEPYGDRPVGYIIYAPGGALSVQMTRTPPVRPFTRGDEQPTDAERQALFASYFGYFGTYTVTSDSTVVHHIEGGTFPSYIGTNQPRQYRLRGDTLTIGGSPATWPCRLFVRVR